MIELKLAEVELRVGSLAQGVEVYDRVLGLRPALEAETPGGRTAGYRIGDFWFRIVEPLSAPQEPEGLVGLAFAAEDLEALHRRLRRLALEPDEIVERRLDHASGADCRRWLESRLPPAATNGLSVVFQQILDTGPTSESVGPAPAIELDLVVISTAEPERATALYGGRLGLDMVLDRRSDGGSQLMQFMAQERMLEVAYNSNSARVGTQDRLWGISWKVADADASRARLAAAGCNVSDVKKGAKRGTRVFTIRDKTCGVPTLVMQQIDTPA